MSPFWAAFLIILAWSLIDRWRGWSTSRYWGLAFFALIIYGIINNFYLPKDDQYSISVMMFFGFLAVFGYSAYSHFLKQWYGLTPHQTPLIYLEARMAVRPTVLGHTTPEGYRLACLFFGAGLLDRTQTLDHGFPYKTFDPIPKLEPNIPTLANLCDQRASEIVQIARAQNKPIRLFWSGGIDSTAACVALLRALQDEPKRLEIIYSPQSRGEYKLFFKRYVKPHPLRKKISHVREALDDTALITTGEHGDQIFGSVKAANLSMETVRQPWQQTFPEILRQQLASAGRADAVLNYLQPQIEKCPVPLNTLFDLLWWLNFSLKWQAVSIRMLVLKEANDFGKLSQTTHHFFATPHFQQWAMANPDKRIKQDWQSYKWPLKDYILNFTGDTKYHQTKTKVPSLRRLISAKRTKLTLAVDESNQFFLHGYNDKLRRTAEADSHSGFSIEVSYRREDPLWDDLSDGE